MNWTNRLRRLERRRRSPPLPPRRLPTLAEFNRTLDELAETLDGEPELLERLTQARAALASEGTAPSRATLREIKRICDDVERLDADTGNDWR